tara:strand:+ start:1083 stop:2342 length:1260 start_codon:yes stop_codon:yes gene_type:complete
MAKHLNILKKFSNRILFVLIFFILFLLASTYDVSEKITIFLLGFEFLQLDELFLITFLSIFILLVISFVSLVTNLRTKRKISNLSDVIDKLLTSNYLPSIIIDKKLKIEYINPAANKIFLNKKNINELHIYDLIKPKNNVYRFENFFNENDSFELPEFENLINQGSVLEVSFQPFFMSKNSKVLLILLDVTSFFLANKGLKNELSSSRKINLEEISIIEKTKKYIARELHDEFAQTITCIKLENEKLLKSSDRKTINSAQIISEFCVQLKNKTRDIVKLLRPAIIDQLGLKSTIEQMIHDWSQVMPKVKIDFNAVDIKVNNEILSLYIFRILQELLTNVQRHSNASRVRIDISFHKNSNDLKIEFYENGDGYQKIMRNLETSSGRGLMFINERIKGFNGQLEVKEHRSEGFVFLIYLES